MPVETADDLAAFTNPNEFGVAAVVQTLAGSIEITGITDAIAEIDRPGMNSNSGMSAFVAGAADVNISKIQFLTAYAPVASVVPDDTLTISEGSYAGTYRIREIPRDGEFCRFLVNRA